MAKRYDQLFGAETRAEYDPKTRTIFLPTDNRLPSALDSPKDRLEEWFSVDTVETLAHEMAHSKYQNTMVMYKIFYNSIRSYLLTILTGIGFEAGTGDIQVDSDHSDDALLTDSVAISLLRVAIDRDKESSYLITNSKNPSEMIALIESSPPNGLTGRLSELQNQDPMTLERWQKEQITTLEYYKKLKDEIGEDDAKYITRMLAIYSLCPPVYPKIEKEQKELPTGETKEFAIDILVPRYRFRVSMETAVVTIENDLIDISDYDESLELTLKGNSLDLVQYFRDYVHTEENYYDRTKITDVYLAPAKSYPEFLVNHLLDLPVQIPTDEFMEAAQQHELNENLPMDREDAALYYVTDLFELATETTSDSLPAAMVIYGDEASHSYIECELFKEVLSKRYEDLVPVDIAKVKVSNIRQYYAWQWLYMTNFFRTEYFSTGSIPSYDQNACTGCCHDADNDEVICHNLRVAEQFSAINDYLEQEDVSISDVLDPFPASPY